MQYFHAFGDGLHHSVLDTIVDHLGEVAATKLPAIEISIGNGDRLENRLAIIEDLLLATDHYACPIKSALHTTTRSAIEIMNTELLQLTTTCKCILEVRVSTVDNDIVGTEM